MAEDQNCEVNISVGTICGSYGVNAAGEVNISGGEIEGLEGIRTQSTAKVTITSGKISGIINGITNDSGKLSVSDTVGETTRITAQ
ncbi:hypothetical protein [Sedimentibacter hydroxybenzoicus]|uniref:hypothetical protein n=1 Tax=Sedimentibacter hydroxybenzoicus TaxID=29345 RepID=UPI0015C6120F|nr:hypothetical protein [Sedimentibacter hydroxybenzoicus]